MKIVENWQIIILVLVLGSILYPVGIFLNYSGVEGQIFQPNLAKDRMKVTPNIYPKNNSNEPVWQLNFYPIIEGNQVQYASSKINIADITVNYAQVTPFQVLSGSNGNITDYGVLNKLNFTLSIIISSFSFTKEITNNFILTNQTKDLTISRNITWQVPSPSIIDALNPLSQSIYDLSFKIDRIYNYQNRTFNTPISGTMGSITVKTVNTLPVFITYTVTALIVVVVIFTKYFKQ